MVLVVVSGCWFGKKQKGGGDDYLGFRKMKNNEKNNKYIKIIIEKQIEI